MKTLLIIIGALVLVCSFTTTAYADCSYNGREYPTGSQIGPYVCQPDGTWKKISSKIVGLRF